MKRIIVTGFEPFGGEKINPSWEAVKLLPDEIGGYKLTKILLPVTFGRAAEKVIDAARDICPDVILSVGQAGGRGEITPELVAINLRYAEIPDNEGYQPKDEKISERGREAYFSTLPMRKISEKIKEADVPSRLSYSAGAYVCNDVLYKLSEHFFDSTTRVGFIHIPYSEEQQREPFMSTADIVKGLKIAIENID